MKYELEGSPEYGFVYVVRDGKKICTVYGKSEQRIEMGYKIVNTLNKYEEQENA